MTLAVGFLWQSDGDLDHDLGDHDDGGHGLVTMVMVIMCSFSSIVDYSLAHEVGRVRLQL